MTDYLEEYGPTEEATFGALTYIERHIDWSINSQSPHAKASCAPQPCVRQKLPSSLCPSAGYL